MNRTQRNIDFLVKVKGPNRDRGTFLKVLPHSCGWGFPIIEVERQLDGDAVGLDGCKHLNSGTGESPAFLFLA